MKKIALQYSDDYIEKLFQYWYANGSPTASQFHKTIEQNPDLHDEYGRIPSFVALSDWFTDREFRSRKDLLDAKVQTAIDDDLVALKVNMLREQAAAFRAVRSKALNHLLETDFDSSSAAVTAFIKASQEERIAVGLSKTIQKMAEMDNDSLVEQVRQLASRVGGVIDMDEVETEDAEE